MKTNEEKAHDIIKRQFYKTTYDVLLEMAEWKKQQIVDWVCDWLNEQAFGGWIDDPVDELIDEFKKAIQNEL